MDLIISKFDRSLIDGKIDFCDLLIAAADYRKLALEPLLALLTVTRPWKAQLKNREIIVEKATISTRAKYDAESAKRLLKLKI